ncbi:YqaE/Pmp3 family membrane protein [Lewinella sp. W8]|uniref:YqaE/Pmp3 family membrane protein n=1 Tax=Lewinella sp. W8 TaxID=2528208 RepID=UPI001067E047|nr:YqaE/Pmp3 family membrane protein [Lewinella sp. W8]MTB52158.1 YqaE/Pmp3 family membrane protein [Lewinella sp. W8]
MSNSTDKLLKIIAAVILPPLAILLHEGITKQFWICLVLTIIFFLPGMVYAIWIVTK